jgi:hypothetical protein
MALTCLICLGVRRSIDCANSTTIFAAIRWPNFDKLGGGLCGLAEGLMLPSREVQAVGHAVHMLSGDRLAVTTWVALRVLRPRRLTRRKAMYFPWSVQSAFRNRCLADRNALEQERGIRKLSALRRNPHVPQKGRTCMRLAQVRAVVPNTRPLWCSARSHHGRTKSKSCT